MAGNFGSDAAEQVLNARAEKARLIAWELRKAEILKADGPLFFQAMADELKSCVDAFNSGTGLTGDAALDYECSNGAIVLGKKHDPILIRRATYRPYLNQVVVRTEIFRGMQKSSTERIWRFDKEPGRDLLLNGETFVECAHGLFDGVADLFA